jgi:phosphatidylserine/phosphatidylglycerophosphate/cardiolipin synthase-like enzyme
VKAEELCDPAFENCRSRLITLIRNETVGIDVAFWFMEDQRYMTEIIARWRAGVPVRLIVDPRATTSGYPANGPALDGFRAAGIPMRMRTAPGILHWKMMLFAGQGVVEFSGANYSPNAFLPTVPYANYVDEAIYFCDDMSIVQSFMTKYDDLWLDTTKYADYANLILPRARVYPVFPKNPELNFPETEDYSNRATGRYGRETQRIDAIMYRITDERHTNAIIAAQARGVAVRLISDTYEYRKTTRLWHSYNLDRLYAAGIPIRVRAHEGLNHQKSVILYGLGMTIFGSSNWTSPSSNSQQEHNLFTTKPWIFQWFVDQFERKWNNTNPDAVIETQPFVPLPPDKPVVKSPATGAVNVATTGQRLKWYGGPWAHIYDIYFGLDPNPPLYAENQRLGPSETTTQVQSLLLPTLQPGTTYYWKVVAKTMAGKTAAGPVWKFTTAGVPPTPPPAPTDASTVTIWASDVPPASLVGMWQFVSDPTAVGGTALLNPDKGKATVTPALAAPANYFDVEFDAMAGVPYHLWIRMRSYNNSTSNDSVSVQFSDSLDHLGTPVYRIGSPSGAEVILRDGAAGTLSGWGWADNGYGVVGPDVYFATTGRHTLRVQTRADGAVIDQIVLSPHAFIRSAPGSGKNDQSMYASTVSGATPQPTNIEMPWQIATLGTVGINGILRRDVATSVYSMYAGGGDIWGTSDGMLFMHQPLSGDGTLVVRVASAVQNTNPLARVGLMIRESLDPGARNAFMFYSAGKTTALQRRHESGGTTIATGGPVNIVAPYWLRLERAGNLFTGYVSKDGVTWTYVASDVVAMPTDVYVGLAGASVNMLTTTAATLDNLTVQPGPPVPPTGPPSLPPLPPGWTNQDIGQVGYTGEASFASSTSSFSIKGAGADIGGSTDGLHFVYRALTGDGTIVARVKTQQNTNADAKAGVMIRESLAPDAANAFMAVTPGKGNKFQRRGGSGAATTVTAGALVKAPYWVKLERLGQTVNAYESADGATWTLVGSDFIGWPETVWIGLAVTSRTMTATSTVTFDSVSVQ